MSDPCLFIFVPLVFAIAIGCFAFGFCAGANTVERHAIEKGHAEYDSVTGAWKWKEKP